MNAITVVSYTSDQQKAWDSFVTSSKNGVFLFERNYMDYHADRFPDHSLMLFRDDRLVAVLPATEREGKLSSHAGLTFGGVVSDQNMKVGLMLDVFDSMLDHLRASGFKRLIYKAVPHIYHRIPAEEDLYALFRNHARLFRRDISCTIDTSHKLPLTKGRKYAAKLAQRNGLVVNRSLDFKTFMTIESDLLEAKYDATPVHTHQELELLAERFPENIKLFTAHRQDEMLAGVVIYENAQVAHTQYIGANEEGKRLGALDLIMSYLINEYYADKRYFDFGISTEDEGRRLNTGLIDNKQSYGARAVAYDFYEIDLRHD